jgi:hypothetical protein
MNGARPCSSNGQRVERYGLPDRMTMDNGSPWEHHRHWTALELWLMRLSIRGTPGRIIRRRRVSWSVFTGA